MAPIACLVFCLLGSFLSTTWAEGPKPRSRCPEGAYSSRQGAQWYCFVFNEEPLSFENAEAVCQESAKNGHLASIKNEKEGRLVGAYVSQRNVDASYVWMGMNWSPTQLKRNGWQWTDGTWFNYSNWNPEEPKRAKWDACAGLTRSSGHKKWFDRKCDSKYPFLCKWKAS